MAVEPTYPILGHLGTGRRIVAVPVDSSPPRWSWGVAERGEPPEWWECLQAASVGHYVLEKLREVVD